MVYSLCNPIKVDVAIVGCGPCGIFAAFQLGIRGLGCVLIDAMESVGGQCAYLYPDKYIYDIPAYHKITGKELTDNLMQQIRPMNYDFLLGTPISKVEHSNEFFYVYSKEKNRVQARYIILSTGSGIIEHKKLPLAEAPYYEERGLSYRVSKDTLYIGKRIIIAGGGDSALDWVLHFQDKASFITLIHRSKNFRGFPHTISKVMDLIQSGKVQFITGSIEGIKGEPMLTEVHVNNFDTEELISIKADNLFVFYGLVIRKDSDVVSCKKDHNRHMVSTNNFMTSCDRVYSVGDSNYYAGKMKLILSGFHESALAAQSILEDMYPNRQNNLQYTTASKKIQKILGV